MLRRQGTGTCRGLQQGKHNLVSKTIKGHHILLCRESSFISIFLIFGWKFEAVNLDYRGVVKPDFRSLKLIERETDSDLGNPAMHGCCFF